QARRLRARRAQAPRTAIPRERVTGDEPATLCLASTRSSQLSYTREREEGVVVARVSRVNRASAEVYLPQDADVVLDRRPHPEHAGHPQQHHPRAVEV